MSLFLYLRNFIQDKQVASIAPTSAVAVERICRGVSWRDAKVVVEYGAGSGVFTKHILSLLQPDATLIAFELNSELAAILRSRINDKRCIVINRSAEFAADTLRTHGIEAADIVISGIPFSFFTEWSRERIIKRTHALLRSGGLFVTYQAFPKPPSKKRPLRKIISKYFSSISIEYEFRNVPPLEVIVSSKEFETLLQRRIGR